MKYNVVKGFNYCVQAKSDTSVTNTDGLNLFVKGGEQAIFFASNDQVDVSGSAKIVQLRNCYGGIRNNGGGGGIDYATVSKLADYLYLADFTKIDYSRESELNYNLGSCASISSQTAGYCGHNFDWTYDDAASVVCRVPAKDGKYATIGVCGSVPGLTDDVVMGKPSSLGLAPLSLVDGVNSQGLYVCVLTTPAGDNGNTSRIINESKTDVVNAIAVVRHLLDSCATPSQCLQWLKNHRVEVPEKVFNMGYILQWHIANINSERSIVVTAKNNVISDVEHEHFAYSNLSTNFYRSIATNLDTTVATEGLLATIDQVQTANNVTPHGNGIERWNMISSLYDSATTLQGVQNALNAIHYTQLYSALADQPMPKWYSEYAGGDLTLTVLADPDGPRNTVYNMGVNAYNNRQRDGKTWQTKHSAVYNCNSGSGSLGTLHIKVQEQDTVYQVSFS